MNIDKTFKKEVFEGIPDETMGIALDTAAKFIIANAIYEHFLDLKMPRMDKINLYRINNPESFGLVGKKRYFFFETYNGYVLRMKHGLYIGMPKEIVQNNPNLFTHEKTIVLDKTDEKASV